MQKDLNSRSLDGHEREQERILVKRLEVQKKKKELEIEQFQNQIDAAVVEIEVNKKQIGEMGNRIEKGKRLVGGAKIKDVFPQPGLETKDKPAEIDTEEAKKHLEKVKKEQEKEEGGENNEGKV